MNLKKKILLGSMIPVAVVLAVSFFAGREVLNNFENKQAQLRISESSKQISNRFDEHFAILKSPLRETFCRLVTGMYSLGRLNDFFIEFASVYPQIERVAVLKAGHRIMAVSKLRSRTFGASWINSKTGLSNIYWLDGKPYVEFRLPAETGLDVAGTIELSTLAKAANSLTPGPSGSVSFYSETPADRNRFMKKKNGVYDNIFPLLDGKWSFELKEKESDFNSAGREFTGRFVVFSVGALVLTYLLAWLVSVTASKTLRFSPGVYNRPEFSEDDISALGHELRNPIAAVKNACYYISANLGKKQSAGNISKHAAIIRNEINIISATIENLLTYMRKRLPVFSDCRVNTMLEELAERSSSRNALIEIITDFGDVPAILADKAEIRQAFYNIIENAFDAVTPPGEIVIATAIEGEFVRITVGDTGCGIKKSRLSSIFEPFVSVKNSGAGLGLAVARKIIEERHRGLIAVKSTPGKGTEVTVKLPLTEGNSEEGRVKSEEKSLASVAADAESLNK